MNKKIILLPLIGFFLASCGGDPGADKGDNNSGNNQDTQETGGGETETGGGTQTEEQTEAQKLATRKTAAKSKLDELVLPVINKISNDEIKQLVQTFYNSEKSYIESIVDIETAEAALVKVGTDFASFAIESLRPAVITKLNAVINPVISAITHQELKESVQTFYDGKIAQLNLVTSPDEIVNYLNNLRNDVETFIVGETERILTALKNKAIQELNPYIEGLIDKIPYDELKDDVSDFYATEKNLLLAVSKFDEVSTTAATIKEDVFDFILSETKKVALAKLKETVDAGLDKIPNDDLRTDLSDFADVEYGKINAVAKIEDVPGVLATVTEETLAHIKTLLVSTVKDYIDKLTQIETATAYDYLPEAMCPTYANNLVNASDIAYNFEEFTNVSAISQKGYGEQWQMVVDNINQSTQLAKVFNVVQTVLNAATQSIKFYVENTYAEEMSYTLPPSVEGVTGKFTYKDLVLSVDLQMTNEHEIPLVGTVRPVISMKYDLLKGEKEMFVSLGDAYKLRYIISDSKYEMATTYGVTIGGKTGSRSSYLGIEIKNGVTSGHIYEYTSLQGSDLIKACADFYVNGSYVSVVGNKASGLVGSEAVINELYNKNTGMLKGYMVEENIEKWLMNVTYHTFFFNLADVSGLSSVKAIPNGKIDPTDNHHDIYLNGNDSNIFNPQHNGTKILPTSRKNDVELRNHYYYSVDNSGNLLKHEVLIPMLFVQDDDKYHTTKYSNTNFSDFHTDMEKSGISNAYIEVANDDITKIRNDCIQLNSIFKTNKENMSSQAINEYLGIVEE